MILVDTSIWIDHLRRNNEELSALLNTAQVLVHPYIVGEIALGSLHNRGGVLEALGDLPHVPAAADHEVLRFIDAHHLFGTGIGYIDAHILAAARLAPGTTLWTRDKRLFDASTRLGLAHSTIH